MSDPFLACDTDGRITYANVAAERVLGPAPSLVGRVLWETSPELRVLRVESLFRRSMASVAPLDLETRLPREGRWHRIRLLPAPTGLNVLLSDIHEERS